MNKVRIGDIATVFDGPHATPKKIAEGPIYLGLDGITDDGRFNPSGFAHLSEDDYVIWTRRVTPQEDDIVFSYEATLGRYVLIPKDFYGCLGRRLGIVRCDKAKVNPRWLYYFFLSPEWTHFTQSHKVRGSTVDRLSVDDFPGYEIPLPSLEEQNRAVDAIFPVDQKIDLNTRLCAELECMARTLYDYWFVQFDFPDENGKPYRSSGGEMVWCQELRREVPKGWRAGKYSDLIDSVRTGLNPRQNFTFSEGGIQYLTVKNLTQEGRIDFTGCDTIDESARSIVHRRSDIRIGDVLFASIAPLGRCYLIQSNPDDWDINESVFSLRPNYSNSTPAFLYLTLKSDQFIAGSTNSSTGSIFKGIRINTLMDMVTTIPPISIVKDFSAQVSSILSKQESLFAENEQLTHLRDWLLPLLMNGQAKVEL